MQALLRNWGEELAHASLEAVTPTVWRVDLDDRVLVLKRRTDHTTVWAEYDLLTWLKQAGIPVCPPTLNLERTPCVRFEGSIYVLYCYILGNSGDNAAELTIDDAFQIGVLLARLHRYMARYPKVDDFPVMDVYGEVASWAWPTVRGYLGGASRSCLDDIDRQISDFFTLYEGLPRQLIHRDAHPGNMVFKDGKLVGLLDFDRVRTGVRIFDLCYCSTAVLSGIFANLQQREQWDQFVQALLRGYVSEQPLTRAEGYAFLKVAYLIQLLFIAHSLDEGDNEAADLNIAILQWLRDRDSVIEPLVFKAIAGQNGQIRGEEMVR